MDWLLRLFTGGSWHGENPGAGGGTHSACRGGACQMGWY